MNGNKNSLAWQEWQGAPKYWALAWVVATAFGVLASPFSTDELTFWIRLFYWAFWNAFSAALMFGVIGFVASGLAQNYVKLSLLSALIFTSIYAPILKLFLDLVFDRSEVLWRVAIDVFLIASLIFTLVGIARRPRTQQNTRPVLYSRLFKFPNAKILAIHAQDHYVEIITDQGNELIRLRFQEAVRDMNNEAGYQVHRSFWVARSAISKIDKAALEIELINGRSIPISKRRLATFQTNLLQNDTIFQNQN